MSEQEEKVGVWNLPEPTDAEEIAYLRHANALLRESIQHQCQLFDNVKAAIVLLDTMKANLTEQADNESEHSRVYFLIEETVVDINHVLLLLGGV